MKRIILLIIAIPFLSVISNCQTNQTDFPVLKGPYPGQKTPGMTPEIFAPGIISTDQFEFGGTFSHDGTEYYFTQNPDNQGSENRIYFTKLENETWAEPINMETEINATKTEFKGNVSPDGKYFFFHRSIKDNGDIWWVSTKIFESLKSNFENNLNKVN